MDAVGYYIADKLGIPATLRTTPQERHQRQEEMMHMAQMAAQQQGVLPPDGEQMQWANQSVFVALTRRVGMV